jgi:shikimate kinase
VGHLVLVGLMGAGKTTVGRRCADALGRPFVDTDDVVVSLAGVPFDELWAREGEARFRELERDAVAQVCASPEPLVVATGGGAVVDPVNRRRLRASGTVVWLRAPVPVLAARVGPGDGRPLLAGGAPGALARLESLRAAAYEAAAHIAVDTEALDVEQVAAAVVDAFRGAGG